MAIVDNTTLKGYFETGDVPTQTQFENLIDTLAQFQNGYILDSDTWTYASATSFTIAGKDVTSRFPVGTKLKLTNASTTKYFYVISTSFSTDTTVNITGGSDFSLASGAITGNYYGYGSPLPGFPDWFNVSIVWQSDGTQPVLNNGTLVGRIKISGNKVHLKIKLTIGSSTTIGSGTYSFVSPIDAKYILWESSTWIAFDVSAGYSIYTGKTFINNLNKVYMLTDAGSYFTNISPFILASEDILALDIDYEM